MGRRRDGRETALQFLFSRDLNQDIGEEDFEAFFGLRPAKREVRAFAEELLRGILPKLPEIDEILAELADNYRLERLTTVDRNILRLAVYEMQHGENAPPAVVINEAIEIAKRFGTEESSRFVNGVLDRFRRNIVEKSSEPPTQPISNP